MIARDIQTTTGKNLRLLKDASGVDPWMASHTAIKYAVWNKEFVEIAATDVWRVKYLWTLLRQVEEAKINKLDENRLLSRQHCCSDLTLQRLGGGWGPNGPTRPSNTDNLIP